MGELSICLGLIIVLTAEKVSSVIQIKKEKKRCDSSADCCREVCRKSGERSLDVHCFTWAVSFIARGGTEIKKESWLTSKSRMSWRIIGD